MTSEQDDEVEYIEDPFMLLLLLLLLLEAARAAMAAANNGDKGKEDGDDEEEEALLVAAAAAKRFIQEEATSKLDRAGADEETVGSVEEQAELLETDWKGFEKLSGCEQSCCCDESSLPEFV